MKGHQRIARVSAVIHGYPIAGEAIDVTEWLDDADDATIDKALYTFERSELEDYAPTAVTLSRLSLSPFQPIPREDILERHVHAITVLVDINQPELYAYIRAFRPRLRDRLLLCSCSKHLGDDPTAQICMCDSTVDQAGDLCETCARGNEARHHDFERLP